jgi:O-antigen ligase
VQMFSNHPVFGVGTGNYPVRYLDYSQQIGLDPRAEKRHPHNLYLEALAETGLVGAAAMFILLWLAIRGAWRARSVLPAADALLAEAVFVGLLVFLANGLFLHASAYSRYIWIAIALALVADRLGRRSVATSMQDPASALHHL